MHACARTNKVAARLSSRQLSPTGHEQAPHTTNTNIHTWSSLGLMSGLDSPDFFFSHGFFSASAQACVCVCVCVCVCGFQTHPSLLPPRLRYLSAVSRGRTWSVSVTAGLDSYDHWEEEGEADDDTEFDLDRKLIEFCRCLALSSRGLWLSVCVSGCVRACACACARARVLTGWVGGWVYLSFFTIVTHTYTTLTIPWP